MSVAWTEAQLERIAGVLRAIGSPIRLTIVCLLAEGEMSVLEIAHQLGTTQPNVSRHLSILAERKILMSRKDRNRVFYSIADQETLTLLAMIREVFCD